jgi:hypothetical protein
MTRAERRRLEIRGVGAAQVDVQPEGFQVPTGEPSFDLRGMSDDDQLRHVQAARITNATAVEALRLKVKALRAAASRVFGARRGELRKAIGDAEAEIGRLQSTHYGLSESAWRRLIEDGRPA